MKIKKTSLILSIAYTLLTVSTFSQSVGIGATSFTPDASAIFEVNSTTQGMLMPRMTTSQRTAITSPAEGLQIFNTTTKCFEAYVNGAWNTVSCPAACIPPAAPTANVATNLNCYSFTANWNASTGANSYYIDVSTNSGFTTFVPGYNNLNVGNVTSYSVTGLTSGITYYYRLRAATACVSDNSGNITAITTSAPSSAPTAGTHTPSQTQIVWNWNTVSGATGYKWGTTDLYSAATDNGASTSKTQTGLTCNTTYTLYVWAYNACGNSTSTTLTQTTSNCCTPGTITDGTLQKTTVCDGSYTVIKWTYSSSPGSTTWTVPSGVTSVEYLVVGGGGGGAHNQGGGGGAGGFRTGTGFAVSGSITVAVGAGGAFATSDGTVASSGGNSVFSNIIANGGGGGGNGVTGSSGGSGGGGSIGGILGGAGNTPSTSPSQGNNGGNGYSTTDVASRGGGGGGANTPGQNGGINTGGNGGAGIASSISGSSITYAGGGGGASNIGGSAGGSGSDGGGNGGIYNASNGTNGENNRGSGGGGGGNGNGGNGGSGIVIIKYLTQ